LETCTREIKGEETEDVEDLMESCYRDMLKAGWMLEANVGRRYDVIVHTGFC
jgi:hypothetical protein